MKFFDPDGTRIRVMFDGVFTQLEMRHAIRYYAEKQLVESGLPYMGTSEQKLFAILEWVQG